MRKSLTLPQTLNFGGKEYKIRNGGDWRVIIDVMSVLQILQNAQKKEPLLNGALYIFYGCIPSDRIAAYNAMSDFIDEYSYYSGGESKKSDLKLIDWDQDINMIISAVNHVAPWADIRDIKYVHWFTFLSYFNEIGECQLSYICGIRHKVFTGRISKLDKSEREFYNKHPEYFQWKHDKEKEDSLNAELKKLYDAQKKGGE